MPATAVAGVVCAAGGSAVAAGATSTGACAAGVVAACSADGSAVTVALSATAAEATFALIWVAWTVLAGGSAGLVASAAADGLECFPDSLAWSGFAGGFVVPMEFPLSVVLGGVGTLVGSSGADVCPSDSSVSPPGGSDDCVEDCEVVAPDDDAEVASLATALAPCTPVDVLSEASVDFAEEVSEPDEEDDDEVEDPVVSAHAWGHP